MLSPDSPQRLERCEADDLGLLGKRRRREVTGAGGTAHRPALPGADERRDARAELGTILTVAVETRAGGEREPGRWCQRALREDTGRREAVVEAGEVVGTVPLLLKCGAREPGRRASHGGERGLTEPRQMLVALAGGAERVSVPLHGRRAAYRDDGGVAGEEASNSAGVIPRRA